MSLPRVTEILENSRDTYNCAFVSIDKAHHMVHAGQSFTVSHTADVAGAGTLDFLIVAPNTSARAHITAEVDVELETDMKLYEAVTATAGTALPAYNRDRNSAKTATVVITHTPSNITEGTTIIRANHMGSGKSYGGGERATHEFILKQNTKYLLRFKNESANTANYMAVKLDWYEV